MEPPLTLALTFGCIEQEPVGFGTFGTLLIHELLLSVCNWGTGKFRQ